MRKKNRMLVCVIFLCVCTYLSIMCVMAEQTEGFVQVEGTKLYTEDGELFQIKAINLSNCLSATYAPSIPDNVTTTENTYKEIAEMGFNTARFLINYQIFEDDDNPYVYKQTGWDWMDQNIEWAQKYNIRLIVNMHIPQGGYQSLGTGMELWQEENKNRLTALWKTIAEKYAEEELIIGWGLVNEPQVTSSEKFELWKVLANRLVKAIRAVDANHICFVEEVRVYGSNKTYIPKISDDNIVYEIHKYPFNTIKYYRKEMNNENIYYGDENMIFIPETEATVICSEKTDRNVLEAGDENVWISMSCTLVAPEKVNAANLKMALGRANTGSLVKIRNITVDEYDQENNYVQTVYKSNDNKGKSYYAWTDEGNAYDKFSTEMDDSINFIMKGGSNYLDFGDYSANKYFKITSGYHYTVSYEVKYTKLTNVDSYISAILNFVNSPNLYSLKKNYIKMMFNIDYLEKEMQAPIFIGEIGLTREELDDEKTGYRCLVDTLDLIMREKYHFAYFNYQSSTHGLYTSAFNTLENRNETLKLVLHAYIN